MMKCLFLIFLMTSLVNLKIQSQEFGYRPADEARGLAVGSRAPEFDAVDQHGNIFHLQSALKKGPVVLVFYRGYWCPVCNRHLSQLQDSLELIYDKGALLVAVSPQKPEYVKVTEEKTHAGFSLLYDDNYKISDAFDVTFMPGAGTRFLYGIDPGIHLKESQTDDSQRLPIPATFIINQDDIIIWRQFNPDYHIRASVKEILEHIPEKN